MTQTRQFYSIKIQELQVYDHWVFLVDEEQCQSNNWLLFDKVLGLKNDDQSASLGF